MEALVIAFPVLGFASSSAASMRKKKQKDISQVSEHRTLNKVRFL